MQFNTQDFKRSWQNIPLELTVLPQWVLWMYELRNGKQTKVPYSTDGRRASVSDSQSWTTFPEACAAASKFDGIGIVLTENNGLTALDLDHCVSTTGDSEPWAAEIINSLDSYTEITPSGRGLRIFVQAKKPGAACRTEIGEGSIEIYDNKRYLTTTGHLLHGRSVECRQNELNSLYSRLFAETCRSDQLGQHLTPVTRISDEHVLILARNASNGEKFCKLFDGGDVSNYPSHSEADLALCSLLAFHTQDPQQVARLFRNSGLAGRPKSKRTDYLNRTIAKALSGLTGTYKSNGAKNGLPGGLVATKSEKKGRCNHLEIARLVISEIEKPNLIYSRNFFWRWTNSGIWRSLDDRTVKQLILPKLPSATKSKVDSVLDLIKTEVNISEHIFNVDTRAINCLNGELHMVDGAFELQAHNRESFRTTQLPITFDPAARAPRFEAFLGQIFRGNSDGEEKKRVVCEAMGYTLLTSCEFEKFFMLVGAGANGKSVLLSVLEALCGRKNTSAVSPSQFDNTFHRAHLLDKLANIVTEIAEGAELPDAAIKAIVSGELITADQKHKPPFEFHPFATLWFGTNHRPATRDFSDAFFRRAIIIEFDQKFEGQECDVNLRAKLLTEMSGILNMALSGLTRLLEQRGFTECSSNTRAKTEWRTDSDQVSQFVDDCCELRGECIIESKELYTAYIEWAVEAGIGRKVTRKSFTVRLFRHGVTAYKGPGGIRMLSGISLKDATVGFGGACGAFSSGF